MVSLMTALWFGVLEAPDRVLGQAARLAGAARHVLSVAPSPTGAPSTKSQTGVGVLSVRDG